MKRSHGQHLSAKERIAIQALLRARVAAKDICEAFNISTRTLQRVAADGGCSTGEHGGYRYSKPIERVRIADFKEPNAIPSVLSKIRGGRA